MALLRSKIKSSNKTIYSLQQYIKLYERANNVIALRVKHSELRAEVEKLAILSANYYHLCRQINKIGSLLV